MIKCVSIKVPQGAISTTISGNLQKKAHKLGIEGALKKDSNAYTIIACGKKEEIDLFVDTVYKEICSSCEDDIEVEPLIKDRDYRGVFRIIE